MDRESDIPFPFNNHSMDFMLGLTEDVAEQLKKTREQFISPQNVRRFRHGADWQSHNGAYPDEVSRLNQVSHEMLVKNEDVIAYRIERFAEILVELLRGMEEAFSHHMLHVISSTCDRVGNVVDGSGRVLSDSLLDVLERIEFGVDREGRPTMPSLYSGGKVVQLSIEVLFQDLPDQKEKARVIVERKISEALNREAARKSRFQRRDHEQRR